MRALLDTNVISEIARKVPNDRVLHYINELDEPYLSAMTIAELYYGARSLRDEVRRAHLLQLTQEIEDRYAKHTLAHSPAIGRIAGLLRGEAALRGRRIAWPDMLIAATAQVHDLALITRNVKDFDDLGLRIVNPWEL
jgi:predicted nucleic acid-binding protein